MYVWKEILERNSMKKNLKKAKVMAITEDQQKLNIQVNGEQSVAQYK